MSLNETREIGSKSIAVVHCRLSDDDAQTLDDLRIFDMTLTGKLVRDGVNRRKSIGGIEEANVQATAKRNAAEAR